MYPHRTDDDGFNLIICVTNLHNDIVVLVRYEWLRSIILLFHMPPHYYRNKIDNVFRSRSNIYKVHLREVSIVSNVYIVFEVK